MKAKRKQHLIGGILTTICGKQLEEVLWSIKIENTTCKKCLLLKQLKQQLKDNIL